MAISRKDFEAELKNMMPEINREYREALKDYVPGTNVYQDRLINVLYKAKYEREKAEQEVLDA